MPGKIVKINVKEGDDVIKGETLIIVEAMKMQSEYKSTKDGIIKKIFVREDDTISGNQILIELYGSF
jgi:biotin carboxyl carrier protein